MSPAQAVDSEKGPVTESQQAKLRTIANPAPAGLFSFASTTFLLSLYTVNTRSIHTGNVVVGMALFTGGLLQFIAGMWEFARGNVLGATAFSSYGAFWASYATILIPSSGIAAAYSDPQELSNAIGLYLSVWFMFTVMLIPVVIRRHVAFSCLFVSLALAFILLASGEFTGKKSVTKAGGVWGIITALIAYYIAISDLVASDERAYVRLPQGAW